MPLVKRTVEPIYIGRAPLDKQVKNELEGVVVNSLAGVIKQLSSMSRHAENLFGDLILEANDIYQRSTSLNKRVEVLYHKTSQLDSTSKEEGKPLLQGGVGVGVGGDFNIVVCRCTSLFLYWTEIYSIRCRWD